MGIALPQLRVNLEHTMQLRSSERMQPAPATLIKQD